MEGDACFGHRNKGGCGLGFRKIGACRVLEVLWSRVYEDGGAYGLGFQSARRAP